MNNEKLIEAVGENVELYNLSHPKYIERNW